jgi:hypothetical protein
MFGSSVAEADSDFGFVTRSLYFNNDAFAKYCVFHIVSSLETFEMFSVSWLCGCTEGAFCAFCTERATFWFVIVAPAVRGQLCVVPVTWRTSVTAAMIGTRVDIALTIEQFKWNFSQETRRRVVLRLTKQHAMPCM